MLMGDYNVIYVVSIFNLIQHKEYMRILKRQLKLQVYLRHVLCSVRLQGNILSFYILDKRELQ